MERKDLDQENSSSNKEHNRQHQDVAGKVFA
jgi:hypothetical protein